MKRREFLQTSCGACAAVAGISWLLQGCASGKYISDYTMKGKILTVKKSAFHSVKKEKVKELPFVLLKPDGQEFPLALYKLKGKNGGEEYKALFLQCTHQGCEVVPYETTVVCPCHGAEFNTRGEVMQGPADTPLKNYPVTQDDDTLYIQL